MELRSIFWYWHVIEVDISVRGGHCHLVHIGHGDGIGNPHFHVPLAGNPLTLAVVLHLNRPLELQLCAPHSDDPLLINTEHGISDQRVQGFTGGRANANAGTRQWEGLGALAPPNVWVTWSPLWFSFRTYPNPDDETLTKTWHFATFLTRNFRTPLPYECLRSCLAFNPPPPPFHPFQTALKCLRISHKNLAICKVMEAIHTVHAKRGLTFNTSQTTHGANDHGRYANKVKGKRASFSSLVQYAFPNFRTQFLWHLFLVYVASPQKLARPLLHDQLRCQPALGCPRPYTLANPEIGRIHLLNYWASKPRTHAHQTFCRAKNNACVLVKNPCHIENQTNLIGLIILQTTWSKMPTV